MDMINGLSSSDQELVMCLTREWIGQKHAKNDACVCVRMILHQASSQSCTAQSVGMQQISFLDYGRKYVLACVFFFCTWMFSLTCGFSYRNQTLLSHDLHHFFQLKKFLVIKWTRFSDVGGFYYHKVKCQQVTLCYDCYLYSIPSSS